jgi:hypothetical protein
MDRAARMATTARGRGLGRLIGISSRSGITQAGGRCSTLSGTVRPGESARPDVRVATISRPPDTEFFELSRDRDTLRA